MLETMLKIPLLLTSTFDFVEGLTILVQDCCMYTQQEIVFFIDRDKYEYSEMHKQNFTESMALVQSLHRVLTTDKHAIIVVSRSILTSVLKHIQATTAAGFYPELKDLPIEKRSSYYLANFNLYEIDDFFVIIPENKKNISGLNYKNLKQKKLKEIEAYDPSKQQPADFQSMAMFAYNLFTRKKDLSPSAQMAWMIFLMGHGTPGFIANMVLNEFQFLLDFFEKQINTKILIYNSCYAGGKNIIDAFQESIGNPSTDAVRQKMYSFPIIALSSGESVTLSLINSDFGKLFSSIAAVKGTLPNYYQILKDSYFFVDKPVHGFKPLFSPTNFPQIRLPGTDFFSVEGLNRIDKNPDYVIISKTLGQTRQKELTISTTAKTIFIYSLTIPFKLNIPKSHNLEKIIWMASGKNYHFSEIYAPEFSIDNFFELCAPFSANKNITCYITTLTLQNRVLTNCTLLMFPSTENNSRLMHFALLGFDTASQQQVKFHTKIRETSLWKFPFVVGPVSEAPTKLQNSFNIPQELKNPPIGPIISKVLETRAKQKTV